MTINPSILEFWYQRVLPGWSRFIFGCADRLDLGAQPMRLIIDGADLGDRNTWISRADLYAGLRGVSWQHPERIELSRHIRILPPGGHE